MIEVKLIEDLIYEVSKGFIGNNQLVKDCILSLCAGLHILIEGSSGLGKTTLAKSIAKATGLNMGRIQFTPDLLPGDITGLTIWEPIKREFILKKGSIFNEFILGDEINRASPRTQSALLEAMEEQTMSIDGISYNLPKPFLVVATKNPSYYIGTYEMPESQLDRFGVLINPSHPPKSIEKEILQNFKEIKPLDKVNCITDASSLLKLSEKIYSVTICDKVMDYIVDIGNKTRNNNNIKFGISTRGLQHLIKLSQSCAIHSGRDYLIPEDVIYSSLKVIPHKIRLSTEAQLQNISEIDVVTNILHTLKIPIGLK